MLVIESFFQPKQIPGTVNNQDTMNLHPLNSTGSPTLLLHKSPPSTIPGLRTYHNHNHNHAHSESTHSTPSSEESNSPTELNSYKRLTDKPPLIKRLAMGLTGTPPDEDNCPLVEQPVEPTNQAQDSNVIVRDSLIKHIEIDNNR